MKRLTGIILGVLAAVAFGVWAFVRDDGEGADPIDKVGDGLMDILNRIARGPRVTKAPYSKVTGLVPGSPDALASEAGVDTEVYSLARMLSSEEGFSSNIIKAAVGWAAVNHAGVSSLSVTRLMTRAQTSKHAGSYGTQKDIDKASPNYGKSDRYASTALDPYQGDIDIASGILSGTIPDPTQGADQFDRPSGESDPDAVAKNRLASGSVQVDVTGINDADLRFWRKA